MATRFIGGVSYEVLETDREHCAAINAAEKARQSLQRNSGALAGGGGKPAGAEWAPAAAGAAAAAAAGAGAGGAAAGGAEVFCLCRKPSYGFMVGCCKCDEWFHGICVGLTAVDVRDDLDFVCSACNLERPGQCRLEPSSAS